MPIGVNGPSSSSTPRISPFHRPPANPIVTYILPHPGTVSRHSRHGYCSPARSSALRISLCHLPAVQSPNSSTPLAPNNFPHPHYARPLFSDFSLYFFVARWKRNHVLTRAASFPREVNGFGLFGRSAIPLTVVFDTSRLYSLGNC